MLDILCGTKGLLLCCDVTPFTLSYLDCGIERAYFETIRLVSESR